MPHVTFIFPCIGRFPDTKYVKSWQMQPLSIAALAALTTSRWERTFFDDRIESINYDLPTDLAAISIETYTARRGYQIASEYRRRGIKVVMGGYHATFCPHEALEHADAVCVGEAEGVWEDILEDFEKGTLSGVYKRSKPLDPLKMIVDRGIFDGKRYLRLDMIETSRGCSFNCKFCSIASFHNSRYRRRPVKDIVDELKKLNGDVVFFVDDNVVCNVEGAKELFRSLKQLKRRWIGQASINVTADAELMLLMADSGCLGLLIGVESLSRENLKMMDKRINLTHDLEEAFKTLRRYGILVYGTFLFGFPHDTVETYRDSVEFAKRQKMCLAAFNHLIPFPGTRLYDQCMAENRLGTEKWWLNEEFRFGDVPFRPFSLSASELEICCHNARKEFYSIPSILRRSTDFSANLADIRNAKLFFALNLLMKKEISQKSGLPLGLRG